MSTESPVVFQCHGDYLTGIIHHAEASASLGVLLVVGGPQYRVGSHRQFVLLAREIAANGIPVMRFDYRGMGDSEGEARTFAAIDDDIQAAIATFYQVCPNLSGVIIWGLCDAASAALFYAYRDERVKGLVLLNPCVFTERGAAKTYLKHYYLQRLLSPDLWRKIFSLQFDYRQSLGSLVGLCKKLINKAAVNSVTTQQIDRVDDKLDLPTRMRDCLQRFKHPVLLILSGRDLTADEFQEAVKQDVQWQSLLADPRISRHDFSAADHTFSSRLWRDQVAEWTLAWLKQLNTKTGSSSVE
ncbi:Hydrolase, exosortase system type 1 associated [Crenothrix polyspora]|jgi:exosortase A-associated hydrolase 1|uniref:Hydrolase, exosortase system type 1 associated n=1 Tax=Crenothrix polyspora TaxID=360316 RepID=A0A1R4HCN2_9GAMM|nr:hydrolase 1, exosortase A system-associated [Crenothrix polyspora]SJM93983.1 Hydrolase, exosortase system type 1 associated [Crenothrix polyspora]